eukprot:5094956-Alexandrium_andersonii.AAC.1
MIRIGSSANTQLDEAAVWASPMGRTVLSRAWNPSTTGATQSHPWGELGLSLLHPVNTCS